MNTLILPERFRSSLIRLPRQLKQAIQLIADVLLLWLALWLAFFVRLGKTDNIFPLDGHLWLFVSIPMVSIPFFIHFGLYRAVTRYFGNATLINLVKAITFSTLIISLAIYWYRSAPIHIPRSMILNYWWLSITLTASSRLLMRNLLTGNWLTANHSPTLNKKTSNHTCVAIYGAGATGNQLAAALRVGNAMHPVAFIDDDESICNRIIYGLQVYSSKNIERMLHDTGAVEILLALPSISRNRRREILLALEKLALPVRSIPRVTDLASGRVTLEQLQDIDIADLLERDTTPIQQDLFEHCIKEQTLMITGAGGTIGAELCRQVLGSQPKALILLDHCEFSLYKIHQELEQWIRNNSFTTLLIPILGNVCSQEQQIKIMRAWHVNTVYHTAAYNNKAIAKHNISESILNNSYGPIYTAQAALLSGVKNFILISTDTAAHPHDPISSSKRLAEIALQALSREAAPSLFSSPNELYHVNKTRFTTVRFGNVLGSSESIISSIRKQIHHGGPVTLKHPDMTRYFLPLADSAQLVIQAGSLGLSGDIFTLDMGQAVNIAEVAKKMVHLDGLSLVSDDNPNGDIPIRYTGLLPEEELHEELFISDNFSQTKHPMIMHIHEADMSWEMLKPLLTELFSSLNNSSHDKIQKLLGDIVGPQHSSQFNIEWPNLHAHDDYPKDSSTSSNG